ncbi:hypothetical protein [Dermacoccus sp. Tok2021]|uniref:AAA family ATPase n=1 Tax=Dermacoccus sp. Tok2021 TaxID=2826873 RepID=UPI001CA72F2A|nr:hypothetical protein [Dermacoccus sp. Tok2021]MBZ4498120.1 hypothetical protein [Dermacoccus sp. Tok2021]
MTSVATAISARLEARFAAELEDVEDAELVRRCADVEELLTVAEAGSVTVAAISPDFPGMNGSVVAELALRGTSVLGVVAPTSPTDARQCEAWALSHVHLVGSGELEQLVRSLERSPVTVGGAGLSVTTEEVGEEADTPSTFSQRATVGPASTSPNAGHRATVVTVWGPAGSPGRTTCATHLAHALSQDGPTLLIDADTVAPACAPVLGLLDEAPGLLAAARLVDAGTLNLSQLRTLTVTLDEGFDVLTGIGRASRWHELSRFHLGAVLDQAVTGYRWIVLDIASDLSVDESLLYDTVAPVRAAAGIEAVERSDVLLALAACDPIGLQRFVVEWEQVGSSHPGTRVVISKAREQAVGGAPEKVVTKALARFADVDPVAVLPDARDELDSALLLGKLLSTTRPDSAYVAAVARVAASLGATAGPPATRRGLRRLRAPR